MPGIYRITCVETGKTYVGATSRAFEKRWKEHIKELKGQYHDNHHLQRAWNKYGEKSFAFEVLEVVELPENLENAEQQWIDYYKSAIKVNGYNIIPIAGIPTLPAESIEKMKLSKKGKKLTEEHKRKIAQGNIGKKMSQEAKEKIGISNKGKIRTSEFKEHLSNVNTGKVISSQTRAKMSASRRTYNYVVTSPDGQVFLPDNLQDFCRSKNLTPSSLHRVAKGICKQHKGWIMSYGEKG